MFVVGSCDFFRSLAGRPTSDEIAAKRELIVLAEKMKKNAEDSLRKAEQKRISDSLYVAEALAGEDGKGVLRTGAKSIREGQLESAYIVMIGTFSESRNAGRLAEKAEEAGFEPLLLECRNGFTAVGINPGNSLTDAYFTLCKAREHDFCPKDAWILARQ